MHKSNKIISMNPKAVLNYLKGTDMIMFAQCEPFALTVQEEALTMNVRRNNVRTVF